jgi:hypothetical protein
MFHRTFIGLIVALVASSVLSPAAAQPAAVEVILDSVSPGTPSGDNEWCIGDERVMLTAHVVDVATQSLVTEGTIYWQVCEGPNFTGFPKEDCDEPGPPRWQGAVLSFLDFDSTPSIGTSPTVPVLGFRLMFRPPPGGVFKRATSVPFNLDTTCAP